MWTYTIRSHQDTDIETRGGDKLAQQVQVE